VGPTPTATIRFNGTTTFTSPTSSIPFKPPQATYNVDVGSRGQLLFSPNYIKASIGDVVYFRFLELNHTLTQSSFEQPCIPSGGFDSSFSQFNPTNATNITISVVVRSAAPMWFFCHQQLPVSHCARGMVFALNPGERMSQFLDNARRHNITKDTGYSPQATTDNCSISTRETVHPPGTNHPHTGGISTPTTVAPGIFYTGLPALIGTGSHSSSVEKIFPSAGTDYSYAAGTGLLDIQIPTPTTTVPGVFFTGVPRVGATGCTCISVQPSSTQFGKNQSGIWQPHIETAAFSIASAKTYPHLALLFGIVVFFLLTSFLFS
jgi:plastocyanin